MITERPEKPLVSVCLLTYNHAPYIRQCIESILMQQAAFSWEIVISDDQSTDNNREIIQQYKAKHPDLIRLLFPEKNLGVIGSIVNLLQASSGEFVAICEGDDFWVDPKKLHKQVNILQANPNCSMVCSNRTVLEKDGTNRKDEAYTKEIYCISDVLKGFIPGTQTIMFRNYPTLINFLKRYNHLYSGDRYLAYFCALMGDIYRMEDITAVYRITDTGVWAQIKPISKLMLLNEQMIEFHKSVGIPLNNEILAEKSFNTSFSVFVYCLKRPSLLFLRTNIHFIFKPFSTFYKMNRLKLVIKAMAHRLARSQS